MNRLADQATHHQANMSVPMSCAIVYMHMCMCVHLFTVFRMNSSVDYHITPHNDRRWKPNTEIHMQFSLVCGTSKSMQHSQWVIFFSVSLGSYYHLFTLLLLVCMTVHALLPRLCMWHAATTVAVCMYACVVGVHVRVICACVLTAGITMSGGAQLVY